MTDDKIVEAMARAIEERRDELIHQPLAHIYGELARAALSVARPMIEAAARRAGAEEMRERAAKVSEEYQATTQFPSITVAVAVRNRALPLEE